MMKKWKCTVCGYIHTGEEPPEKCPVCGADRSMFVLVEDEPVAEPSDAPLQEAETDGGAAPVKTPTAESPETDGPKSRPDNLYDRIGEAMTQNHAHPISVHIPNGLLPVCVLFIILAAIFQHTGLGSAAVYNMAMVVLAMPFVILSGVNDWRRRFGGHLTSVFVTKMVCAGLVSVLAVILLCWGLVQPDILLTPSLARAKFIALSLILFAAAAVAGYMGGKLVIFPGGD
jgi:uncharacterized membrane protein